MIRVTALLICLAYSYTVMAYQDHNFTLEIAETSDNVKIYFSGMIRPPFAEQLKRIISSHSNNKSYLLQLDSVGGSIYETKEAIEILKQLTDLTTIVQNGAECSSNCVPLFVQGQKRLAGEVSSFMFHGIAIYAVTNIPDEALTNEMISFYKEAGINMDFIDELKKKGVYSTPGMYWMTGKELFENHSLFVTKLIERHYHANPYNYDYSAIPH